MTFDPHAYNGRNVVARAQQEHAVIYRGGMVLASIVPLATR